MVVVKFVVLVCVVVLVSGGAASSREQSWQPEAEAASRAADGGQLPVFLPEPLRMIAEKAAKGEEISAEDVPQELRELIADIEVVCEFDRNLRQSQQVKIPAVASTRTGRGLLASLHWLTNSPLAFYTGSGTLNSMQSLTILGRIINSALRLDYGPVRSQGATTMMPEARV